MGCEGVLEKIPFMGKVWIFPGTTQCNLHLLLLTAGNQKDQATVSNVPCID